MNGSVMNGSVMNVVCFEWSLMKGLFLTSLFWTETIYIHMQNKQHPW